MKIAADDPKPTQVYFVQFGRFIKIGFTTNLKERLKNFRGAPRPTSITVGDDTMPIHYLD